MEKIENFINSLNADEQGSYERQMQRKQHLVNYLRKKRYTFGKNAESDIDIIRFKVFETNDEHYKLILERMLLKQ